MAFRIVIEPVVLEYDPDQEERWCAGHREDCYDEYCRSLKGSRGFGEYLVGRHFEAMGYRWIHHDFDVFGTNKPAKYASEAILLAGLGDKRLSAIREVGRQLRLCAEEGRGSVETPDLLIYKPGASEIRFAECKRIDTRDKLNGRQVFGLVLIGAALHCPVDLFVLKKRGEDGTTRELNFSVS
jgi:hypothetical protein